jgi:hypothetical protein
MAVDAGYAAFVRDAMRSERRGAAGIRAFASEAGVEVDGWCADEIDPVVATRSLREELHVTNRDPEDLVDDYDFVSVWCAPTGDVGGMQLRTRQPRRPLHELVAAADAWLARGGLADAVARHDR